MAHASTPRTPRTSKSQRQTRVSDERHVPLSTLSLTTCVNHEKRNKNVYSGGPVVTTINFQRTSHVQTSVVWLTSARDERRPQKRPTRQAEQKVEGVPTSNQ